MKLENKTILITGASRGLGASMAEECSRTGANVVIAAPTEEELEPVAERIRSAGGEVEAVPTDVSDPAQVEYLMERAVARFKTIHGLINNAGVNYVKPFLEVSLEDWHRVLSVDLTGAFLLTQLCARHMKENAIAGSIVQIASVHTHASLMGAAPYDAAKMGLVGFSKAAAVELAPLGIRINIVSPGLCETHIWKDIMAAAPSEKECTDYWNANIPGQRLIAPAEIAKCCIFLLSEDASSVTGANLFADLGMTSLLVSREPYASKTID